MPYYVKRVPDGTLSGDREWAVGVADEPQCVIAYVELSATEEERVFEECWRAACSPQAVAQASRFRPVA